MSISKGAQVRQVVPVIAGIVVAKKFNDDTDVFEYLVAYTHPQDGHAAEKWFTEEQIQEVTA